MRPSLFLLIFITIFSSHLSHAQLLNSSNNALDIDLDESTYVIVEENPAPAPPEEPIITIDIKAGDTALEMRQKLIDRIYGITIDEKKQLIESINRDFDNFSIEDKKTLDERLARRKARQDEVIKQADQIKTTIAVPVEKLKNSLIEVEKQKIENSFKLILPEMQEEQPNKL